MKNVDVKKKLWPHKAGDNQTPAAVAPVAAEAPLAAVAEADAVAAAVEGSTHRKQKKRQYAMSRKMPQNMRA